MEDKAIHYDGSIQNTYENSTDMASNTNDPFEITDEMRKNIGGNPFVIE